MPEARAQQQEAGQSSFLRTALQSIGIFLFIQFGMKQIMNTIIPQQQPANSEGAVSIPSSVPDFSARPKFDEIQGQVASIPQNIAPIWSSNTSVDISLYISQSLVIPSLSSEPANSLVMQEKNMLLGNYDDARDIHTTFELPKQVQNNGTLWAHFYISQSGAPFDLTAGHYDPALSYHFIRPLNRYFLKKKIAKTRNLLSDNSEDATAEQAGSETEKKPRTIASYYHPNFTLSFVPNVGTQSYKNMHPAVREWVNLESTGARDVSGQNGWYYPVLWLNTFWQLRDHMTELNSTVERLPLNIHLNNLAYWKFSMLASLDFGIRQNAAKVTAGETLPGGGDGSEMEEIKRIVIDSNVYLLSTTVIVGIFHTIFEMLAFKSDVSHWRNKKDNVGVSVRTILANVFMQTIIFLYLMDNNDNTSWMILFGQGLGILLEAWKITKTVDVRIRPTPANSTNFPWRYLPYTIVFEDKHKLTQTEEKTKEYDEIAFQYLYWIAIPLLLAYAVYSLYYDTHKSWYSFVITTLVGSVYAYGFLMMVPSLYINYRLQSVAHMPGRTMMYKFLNTFIDDLFAFTVKMPTLHRLATLRDDVIFFVYIYQAWKYRVDYSRVNEFGQGGEEDAATDKKDANVDGKEQLLLEKKDADADAVKGGQVKKRQKKNSSKEKLQHTEQGSTVSDETVVADDRKQR